MSKLLTSARIYLGTARNVRDQFAGRGRDVGAVVALALLSGLAEACALALAVQLAITLSASRDDVNTPVGMLGVGLCLWLGTGLLVLRSIAGWVQARQIAVLTAATQRALRIRLLEAYSEAGWSKKEASASGRIQDLLGNQVTQIGRAVQNGFGVAVAVASFVAMLGTAVLVNSAAALLSGIASVALLAIFRPLTRRTRVTAQEVTRSSLRLAEDIDSLVEVSEVSHVMAVGASHVEAIIPGIEVLDRLYRKLLLLSRGSSAIFGSTAALLVYAFLAAVRLSGTSNIASLGAVIVILVRATSYSQTAQTAYQSFVEQASSGRAIGIEIGELRLSRPRRGSAPLGATERIDFTDCSLVRPNGVTSLNHVTLSFRAGERVAITGVSGAGKSSLIEVLVGLREPTSGGVFLNGATTDSYAAEVFASQVAYLPQRPRLLRASVAENVRFFRSWVTDEMIEAAVDAAGLADEVGALPQGLATPIGAPGAGLSGGQMQRICLARALAGGPTLLVLDEPTSALDEANVRRLGSVLGRLPPEIIVLVVTHDEQVVGDGYRRVTMHEGSLLSDVAAPGDCRMT